MPFTLRSTVINKLIGNPSAIFTQVSTEFGRGGHEVVGIELWTFNVFLNR